MLCIGILWNTVYDFRSQCLADISDGVDYLEFFEVDFENDYNNFIRDVYVNDGIAEWKLNQKMSSMLCDSGKTVIIIMQIDSAERVFNVKKNKYVFLNVENLKSSIRSKYSNKVESYFFDNIFHMTDNEDEVKSLLSVMEKWCYPVFEKYNELNQDKNKKMIRSITNDNK